MKISLESVAAPRSIVVPRPCGRQSTAHEGRNPTIDRKLFGIGLVGAIVTAVCCVTPVLAVVLGVLGLSAWLGWTDYVIVAALGVFLALLIVAASRRKGGRRT